MTRQESEARRVTSVELTEKENEGGEGDSSWRVLADADEGDLELITELAKWCAVCFRISGPRTKLTAAEEYVQIKFGNS